MNGCINKGANSNSLIGLHPIFEDAGDAPRSLLVRMDIRPVTRLMQEKDLMTTSCDSVDWRDSHFPIISCLTTTFTNNIDLGLTLSRLPPLEWFTWSAVHVSVLFQYKTSSHGTCLRCDQRWPQFKEKQAKRSVALDNRTSPNLVINTGMQRDKQSNKKQMKATLSTMSLKDFRLQAEHYPAAPQWRHLPTEIRQPLIFYRKLTDRKPADAVDVSSAWRQSVSAAV